MPSPRRYRLIDADAHVNEPPDLWQSRVPARFKDRAPRMEHFEQGDAWVLEGVADPINFGMNATAGFRPGDMRAWVRWDEVRPGGYDPKARLSEMDEDQVDAEVLYPTPRLSHSIVANQDVDFHLACIRAYNDWLSEFCSEDPTRLGGVAMIPNRGVDGAIAELERAMALPGMVGALMSCYPHGDLDISPDDDPFFEALAEAGIPLHIHVAMVDGMPSGRPRKIAGDVRIFDAPSRILQLVWSGLFERIPALNLVMVEVDCGWVPYVKEQADDRFQRLALGAGLNLPNRPSHYIERNINFTYITDSYGVRNRHAVGVERIMWSSDFPHVGANWPNSWRTIAADYTGVPAEERDLMLAGNAQRLYRFDTK